MNINVKKLDEKATIPEYANPTDAGLDLTATSKTVTDTYVEYGTGLAFQIPDGCVGLLFSRSSISKKNLVLANGVGVLDSGYRGEVKLRFKRVSLRDKDISNEYIVGDRIGQLVVLKHPPVALFEVNELKESERGSGGFGSTGR